MLGNLLKVQSVAHGRRLVLVPKEHGAWGILLVPLAIGLAVAGSWTTASFLLLGTTLFFFFARYPLVLWARAHFEKFPLNSFPSFLFSVGHGTFLGLLLLFKYELWLLLPLAGGALLLLIVHLYLVSRRQERTEAGELLGVCALTLTAPAAYYVSNGEMTSIAWYLWLLSILYFGSGIFYVKMKLGYRSFTSNPGTPSTIKLAWPLAFYQLIALACIIIVSAFTVLPALTILAFLPLTIYMAMGTLGKEAQLNVKRLGWTLVILSLIYGVLLSAILRIGLD